MGTVHQLPAGRRARRLRYRRDASLGAQLRRVRDRQGLSLGTIASLLCISRDRLDRIERGILTEGPAVDRVARWLAVPRPPARGA